MDATGQPTIWAVPDEVWTTLEPILCTCDPGRTRAVVNLFHYLTGHSQASNCVTPPVAPRTMRL
jgi:hypothetical protein